MSVLIACEGVLRTPTGAPIPEGIALYAMLCQGYRVVLCLDGPVSEAEHWLISNGFTLHDAVMDHTLAYTGMDLRERHVDVERTKGRVEMLVDPSPERVAMGLRKGITSILFAHPQYARPEFRPDLTRKIRPWESIAAELDAQNEILRDQRLGIE